MEDSIFYFGWNVCASNIFSGIRLVTHNSKKKHLISMISFELTRLFHLWISSNFGQATFIEGALKYGKMIYGLIHRKIWKPAKPFQKLDDRNLVTVCNLVD